MAFTEPVLTKRIPQDPAKRHAVWYDEYVATGGYAALRKALAMTQADIIKTVTAFGVRTAPGLAEAFAGRAPAPAHRHAAQRWR